MKLTKSQQIDLDTVLYYLDNGVTPTEADIRAYFAWSDKGDKSFMQRTTPGALRLRHGKTYRDLQVTSYLEDWGKYITAADLAQEEPEFICQWLSKVMKKPAIISMWRLFNDKSALTDDDMNNLKPLRQFARILDGGDSE